MEFACYPCACIDAYKGSPHTVKRFIIGSKLAISVMVDSLLCVQSIVVGFSMEALNSVICFFF